MILRDTISLDYRSARITPDHDITSIRVTAKGPHAKEKSLLMSIIAGRIERNMEMPNGLPICQDDLPDLTDALLIAIAQHAGLSMNGRRPSEAMKNGMTVTHGFQPRKKTLGHLPFG